MARPLTASERLARFCVDLSWTELPEGVRRRTAELVLDHVGVAMRGSLEASSVPPRAYALELGPGRSTILGTRHGVSAPAAALANGTAAHALELDDVERASVLHPGVCVIPAALAVAEETGASGARTLEAVVCGYEVTLRVGEAMNGGSVYRRGFHPTGVAGAFGATAAAAKLLRLDPARFSHALGIAGSMAAGSLAYLDDGAWTKRLNAGWAASAGCAAASLARHGFTGPSSILDGPLGTLHAYSDAGRPERLTSGLGGDLGILRVAIKPYGCCRWVHAVIDCALDLRARGVRPEDVEGIRLGILTVGALLVAEPIERKRAPATVVEAQFSAPFAAALALVRGSADLDDFTGAALADPAIGTLMAKSVCYTDPALDARFPDAMPGAVEVALRGDRTASARTEFPLGEPEKPLGEADLVARFTSHSSRLLGADRARDLAARLLALEREPDLAAVTSELRRAAPAGAST